MLVIPYQLVSVTNYGCSFCSIIGARSIKHPQFSGKIRKLRNQLWKTHFSPWLFLKISAWFYCTCLICFFWPCGKLCSNWSRHTSINSKVFIRPFIIIRSSSKWRQRMKRGMQWLFDYPMNFCYIFFLFHFDELSFCFQFFSVNCNFDFFYLDVK